MLQGLCSAQPVYDGCQLLTCAVLFAVLCADPVDPCAGNTCSGHGTCAAGVCTCTGSYTGDNCEIGQCPSSAGDPCLALNQALIGAASRLQAV
jgi:hypothetical protein